MHLNFALPFSVSLRQGVVALWSFASIIHQMQIMAMSSSLYGLTYKSANKLKKKITWRIIYLAWFKRNLLYCRCNYWRNLGNADFHSQSFSREVSFVRFQQTHLIDSYEENAIRYLRWEKWNNKWFKIKVIKVTGGSHFYFAVLLKFECLSLSCVSFETPSRGVALSFLLLMTLSRRAKEAGRQRKHILKDVSGVQWCGKHSQNCRLWLCLVNSCLKSPQCSSVACWFSQQMLFFIRLIHLFTHPPLQANSHNI